MTDSSEARLDEVRQFLADVENRWPSGREVVRLKKECGFLLSEVGKLQKENEKLNGELGECYDALRITTRRIAEKK